MKHEDEAGGEMWLHLFEEASGVGLQHPESRAREDGSDSSSPRCLTGQSPNTCCCCQVASVRLCATPQTEAHQAPPSLGFSRQEHGRGLPFPSPMHESEK